MAPIEPLPNRTVPWPPNILAAYQIIDECCTRAYNMLHQADMDPIRLRIQQEKLTSDVFPLLLGVFQVLSVFFRDPAVVSVFFKFTVWSYTYLVRKCDW